MGQKGWRSVEFDKDLVTWREIIHSFLRNPEQTSWNISRVCEFHGFELRDLWSRPKIRRNVLERRTKWRRVRRAPPINAKAGSIGSGRGTGLTEGGGPRDLGNVHLVDYIWLYTYIIYIFGGFLKWCYPQFSSIFFLGFSMEGPPSSWGDPILQVKMSQKSTPPRTSPTARKLAQHGIFLTWIPGLANFPCFDG